MENSFKGILYPARLPAFHRIPAPPALVDLIQWFWIPEWDLEPGRSSRQLLLAYPSSNLVIEGGQVQFVGPTTRCSHRDLVGSGWAVGARLRPAIVPHLGADPTSLRDGQLSLALPELLSPVATAMSASDPEGRRSRAVEAFADWLTAQAFEVSAEGALANRMTDLVDADQSVTRVEDLATVLSISTRTLQRVARKFIGLSPAMLIRRRRLQDAADRPRTDPSTDLSLLAAEFGYVDHAHLTNDFRRVLGFTPSSYRQTATTDAPHEDDPGATGGRAHRD